jgi:cation diffusion facilitator CzcD-associated flavoprotein CzcO
MADTSHVHVAVIGAGPGGIATAVRLLEAGIDDFVILEKAAGVGGTWWNNRYPGLECDVPSHLYSFSFALKPDWSKPYAGQPEILDYMQKVVADFGLWPFIRCNTKVVAATWDEAAARWTLRTEGGDEVIAAAVVSSQGMFGELHWPDIAGRESFEGTAFHSGAWRTDLSLEGLRVAVIGSAASAVQFVPEIAKTAGRVHVYQRSANWVLPKEDTPFTAAQLATFVDDRRALEAERAVIQQRVASNPPFGNPETRALMEDLGRKNIEVVDDPALREKLLPATPWGCQRPLFSNVYYPTFNLPHIELVTEPIECITPHGVVTADGTTREVDVIIYATGYETTRYASVIDFRGRDGRSINDAWSDGALAYLGISTSGFPNLFMLYGPNTNHGSIIFMIECQVAYVVRMLSRMRDQAIAAVDVRPEVMAAYNEQLQRDLDEVTVWSAGCHQYYRGPSGRIVTQWPHSMYRYQSLTEAPVADGTYELVPLAGA